MPSLLDLFVNVKVSGTGTVAGELAGISSQASKTDKAVGSSMRSIGSSMSRVGRGMSLFVTAPIALAGAAAIKMGAQFDQALTNAVSVTGKTGAAAEQAKNQMNDLALTLGAKTAFSAKDAADAMYDLASSGWSVNDMQKGLNGIMALAAATQTDLADATGTVTSTLAAFKLESQDSGHVSDVFTAAINKSRLQMDDLSQGMKYVGPIAAGFGLSLEETTAALAEMADAGIEGSQAGTTLRASLSALAAPVGAGADTLHALGVSFDEVNPKTHSLAEIMGTLKNAGMDTNDAIKIFGREASAGMIAVAQRGAPALQKLTKELKNSGGTAERTAKMQLDTLAGAWQNLSGSLETAAIRFEQQVEPALKAITNGLVPVVNRISALNPVVKSVIIGFLAFAAALGPLLVVGGLLLQAWGTISLVFASTSVTLAGIVSVAIPVIAAVAALAAIGIVLYKNWNQVKAAFAPLVTQLRGFLQVVFNVARGTDNFTGAAQKLHPALIPVAIAAGRVAAVMRGVLAKALNFVRSQAQVLINWWRNNLPLIQKVGSQVFSGLRKLVGQSLSGLVKLVKGIIGGLIVFWRINHKQLTNIARAAWDVIKTIVRTAIRLVLDIIKLAMQLLTGDWKGAWNTIKDILKTLWNAMVQLVRDSLKIFVNIIKAAWNTVKAATASVADYIGDKLKAAWDRAVEISKGLRENLGEAWQAIKEAAADAWQAINEAMWQPIENAYNKIKGFINNIIGIVNHVLKAFGKDPIPELGSNSGGGGGGGGGRSVGPQGLPTGNARAYARGGIAGPGRMGVVGEGGEREAVVNLERRTPESQQAFRAAARSPNASRGHRLPLSRLTPRSNVLQPHGRGEDALGATMYTWIPQAQAIVDRIEGDYNTKANTYSNHPVGFRQPFYRERSMDFWGPGGRGDNIDHSVGDAIAQDIIKSVSQLNWIIWDGQMLDGTGYSPYGGHEGHVHATAFAENWTVGGGKGIGGFGPSLAEQMWNGGTTPPNGWKGAAISGFLQGLGPVGGLLSAAAGAFPGLSKLLPSKISGMGPGVLGSAANAFLSGSKGWIHDWIFDTFGGTSGSGGASPKGLTIGEALTSGGWPGNLVTPASGIVWRESRGNAHAQNPSGARGLMQIMPGTAQGVGADYSQLYDPVYNTRTGYSVYKQAGGFSPWVTSPGGDYTDRPVTGYDYGGLIKRDHLAKVHANELYMPLDRPHVERTAQTALGTSELRGEIAELRAALTDGGIRVKDYGRDAQHIIVSGAHNGGLRAMGSKDGKNITVATVSEVQRNDRLKGKVRN